MSTSVIIPTSTLDDRSIPPSQETTTSYHQHTANHQDDDTISSHSDNHTTKATTHIPPALDKEDDEEEDDDYKSIVSVKQERRESQVTIQELPNTTTVRRDSISNKSITTTHSIHNDDDTTSSSSDDDEEQEEIQGFIPQKDNTSSKSRSDDTIPSTPSSKSPSSFDASANHSDYSNATSIQDDDEEEDNTKLDHKQAEKQHERDDKEEMPTTTTADDAASSSIETKDLPAIPPSTTTTSSSNDEKAHPPKPAAIDTSSSTTASSRLFGIWSSIKSASGRWPSQQQQQQPSQQTAMIIEHHERKSKRLSQQHRSASEPDLGHEDILTQMENLNIANTSDPKVRMLVGLKRQSVRDSLKSQYLGRDDFDWDFWAGLLCDFEQTFKAKQPLLHHVQHGIPPSIRGMVWQLLANSKDAVIHDKYIELLKAPSAYDKMIQRDLARTFPGHKFFKDRDGVGQEGLYNVVRAYSVLDQEVGYCQGLAFIVGPLLLNMPDDEAFCVLIRLMNDYGLRGHFTPDMEGLHLRLYQFDMLVEEHLPHIARHLNQQGVGSTMYASQWFMTLFAYKFPLNLVFRIYDLVLVQGISSIFQFAIALLKRNQTTILGLDFEHLLNFLKNGLFEEYKDDDRQLVADACTFEITARRLQQLEKDHKVQMAKEVADARTLDQLQRNNNDLRNQIRALEQASSNLQKEHGDIHEQLRKTRADLTHAHDERSSLQDLVDLLKQEVDTLPKRIESQCRTQFESLCVENAKLVERNSMLEDQLAGIEMLVIDMKMRYAQTKNECGELQQKLNDMKRVIG